MKNPRILLCLAAFTSSLAGPAAAQTVTTAEQLAPMADAFRKGWAATQDPIRMTIPVHDGVLEFAMPHGFVPVLKAEGDGQFFMAFIPDGEDWGDFSRAVLIQSSAQLGAAPDPTATIAEAVFKPRTCTGDPFWQALGEKQVGSPMPAYLASTGCASLGDAPERGQQTLLVLLRGTTAATSLSYAVRAPAFASGAPPLSAGALERQLASFGDIIVCRSAEQPGCREIWAREGIRRNMGQ